MVLGHFSSDKEVIYRGLNSMQEGYKTLGEHFGMDKKLEFNGKIEAIKHLRAIKPTIYLNDEVSRTGEKIKVIKQDYMGLRDAKDIVEAIYEMALKVNGWDKTGKALENLRKENDALHSQIRNMREKARELIDTVSSV